jgi:hypothetical protein
MAKKSRTRDFKAEYERRRLRAELEKVAREEDAKISREEKITPQTPAPEPPAPEPDRPKAKVDFSKYKDAKPNAGTQTPPPQPNVPPTPPNEGNPAPQQPPAQPPPPPKPNQPNAKGKKNQPPPPPQPPPPTVVAINGTVLMAIVNFICPAMFSKISSFVGVSYEIEDFKLTKDDMKDLLPAADIVAKQVFANIPPIAQLIIGYGAMSWSAAGAKKAIREKKEGEKK